MLPSVSRVCMMYSASDHILEKLTEVGTYCLL